jgi:cytoskeletal protein RodZ
MSRLFFTDSPQPSDVLESQIVLGKKLRDARELQKIDLQTVCDSLKIRRFFLECMENGRFDQLPGTIYTMGFVKSYAQYLGVDVGAELEQIISLSHQSLVKTPERSYLLQKNKSFVPLGVVITSVVCVAGFIGLAVYFKDIYGQKTASFPTKSLAPQVDDLSQSGDVFKVSPPVARDVLQLSVTRQTWIKITDGDGKLVVARLLTPGAAYEIAPQKGYSLTSADAGALIFSVNGASFSLPKSQEDNTLLENMPIDLASLQAMVKVVLSEPMWKEPKEP